MTFSIIKKSQLEGAKRFDAEYYQPEYLNLIINLNKLGAIPVKDVVENPKVKFKPQKKNTFQYIEISSVNLLTGEYNEKEILGENAPDRAQWLVKKNNILVSMVRPIRNAVCLIRDEVDDLVCSSGFAVLEPCKIESEYFFIYLKSKPIIKLLDRMTTATMYPAITVEDILNTRVYMGARNFRLNIKNKVNQAQENLNNSKTLYQQAEKIFIEALDLKDFQHNDELSSVVNLSEVKRVNRMDAEFFQKKCNKIIKHLENKYKVGTLNELVNFSRGVEPGAGEYFDEGKSFIRVSNLTKYGIDNNDQKYLREKLYKELRENYQSKKGEILLTKDASPGIAYYLKEDVEGIISGGVLRLQLTIKDIEPEYLTLCLNSIVGQMQAERDSGGSVIAHWKPEQIKNVLIPILPRKIQEKIADLVYQSFDARSRAEYLLDEAKRKVEEIIEQGNANV